MCSFSCSWENKKKKSSYRKKYIEEFMKGILFFWLRVLRSMSFCVAFFVFSLPFPNWHTCWMVPIKIHNITMVSILCDDMWWYYGWIGKTTAISCNLILASLHLQERAIILDFVYWLQLLWLWPYIY